MKYLAVQEATGKTWIEQNDSAISHVLVNGIAVAYYPIKMDADNVPTLGARVTLSSAPRVVVKETTIVDFESDGQVLGSAEAPEPAPVVDEA